MKDFFQKKIVEPILHLLKQGVSPAKLAWAVSAGIVIATVPVFGACTVLCLAAIWLFRLNPVAVLLVNQVAFPLQFLLYFPLLRSGEWLFNAQSVSLSISQIFSLFQTDLLKAIQILWWSTLYGVTIWTLISIPLAYFIFLVLKSVFTKASKTFESAEA
jgi:uncharacterized protein (DUF2062 family)